MYSRCGNREKSKNGGEKRMLKIYAVKKDVEYISFWLRKGDAEAEATHKEDCVVVPIVVQEKYPRTEEDE